MNNTTYEYHNFNQDSLPVKLKHITITNKSMNWVNWHNDIELLYFISGNGYVISNSVKYPVFPGDLFIVNSNHLHYTQTDSLVEYFCLIIDSEYLNTVDINVSNLEYQYIVKSENTQIMLKKLIEEISNNTAFRLSGIISSLLSLMTYLSRFFAQEIYHYPQITSSVDEKIKSGIKYIQTHISETMTLDEIASHLWISKDYFSHIFKKSLGITPITYINKLRCYNAQKLLRKNTYSIHQVAALCGFENDSYFAKTFKKHIGISPSKYSSFI